MSTFPYTRRSIAFMMKVRSEAAPQKPSARAAFTARAA